MWFCACDVRLGDMGCAQLLLRIECDCSRVHNELILEREEEDGIDGRLNAAFFVRAAPLILGVEDLDVERHEMCTMF